MAAGIGDCNLGLRADIGFSRESIDAFRELHFTGDVEAVEEGRAVLAGESLMEVTAPLPEALPFESWTAGLGSRPLPGTRLGRLTHRCRMIETKGENYQLQNATVPTTRESQSCAPPVDEPTIES
ncbi:MAG: hypothetical protein ACRDXC_07065 [Acidimicrobiales bacterium]